MQGLRSTKVKSFVDFVQNSDFMDLLAGECIFRGQSVQGNLLPGIARKNPKVDTTAIEKKMLSELSRLGASFLPDTSQIELMVRAQHYGLKTRLLDWTPNSLAALWFACSSAGTDDAYVYALEVSDLLFDSEDYLVDPFATRQTRAFWPRFNNARISAQNGLFTLHRFNQRNGFVPLEKNALMRKRLHEFVIAGAQKIEILYSLERHGVSARTIYPDMEGLCQYLNMHHLAGVPPMSTEKIADHL